MPRLKRPRSSEENLSCKICNQTYDDPSSLYRHMNTHPGVEIWHCEACGKIYSKKQTLQAHRCYTARCDLCDKKFRTKQDLETHNKETHIGPWKCISLGCEAEAFTDKLFLRNHYLDKHVTFVETNSGKPWCCKVIKDPPLHRCAAWFTTRSSINRHISSLAGYKPYSCNICSKQFIEKWQVTAHVKSVHGAHEEFTWSCCDIFFTSKRKFTHHIRYVCATKGQHARSSRRISKKSDKKKRRASKAHNKGGNMRASRERSPAPPPIYKDISLHYQECLRCHRFGEQRFELVLCNQCKQGFHHRCITKGHKAPLTLKDLSNWKCSQCKDLANEEIPALKRTFISKSKAEKSMKKECKMVSFDGATPARLKAVVTSGNTSSKTELKRRNKLVSVVDIGVKKPPQVLVSDIGCESNVCPRY